MKKIRILLALLLTAALLAGCGTASKPESTPVPLHDKDAVVVTDIAELLNALAPGTVIEIDADNLALDRAPDYGFSYASGSYTWQQVDPGQYALVIRDLEGLTIRGRHEGVTTLTTGATYANVIEFRSCKNLTVEGLTLGHRGEPGICMGDVLYFDGCEDVLVSNCDLFGCGVTAVNAWKCTRLTLKGCTLRDCSVSAMNITLCTNVQARDCEILRCGRDYGISALCVASCNGFALINSSVRDGNNTCLLDEMNSSSVCLLGCEATGNRFSEALFRIYDGGVTVSGCALSDNEFSKCYAVEGCYAVTGSGQALVNFSDFVHMELKPFEGEYIGPAPYVTPGDLYSDPVSVPEDVSFYTPPPLTEWDGDYNEAHVTNVDELLAAIAPHTTIYLDAEEFDLSTASDYGTGQGGYYKWVDTYDGPELVLHNLEDFTLIGGGMGITLLSAVPRYANVLNFVQCSGVKLSDMTIGHSVEPGYCSGDVLEMSDCTNMNVEHCGLYGCGEIGINANGCSDIYVYESNIYECSYLGADLFNVQRAVFTGCSITDCGGNYGFNGILLQNCSDVFYDGDLLSNGNFIIPVPA